MADKRQRLAQRLVRVREIAERQEVARARVARDGLEEAREAVQVAETRAEELDVDIRRRTGAGVSGLELVGFADLAAAARRGVANAEDAREEAAACEKKAAEELLVAIRERQAAEKLLERAKEAADQDDRKREQNTLDEIATQRHGR